LDILTDQELKVFRLIGSGLSTREIAERMKLSIKTIGTYRDRIKQKLCIKNGAKLTRHAVLCKEKEHFGNPE
jgi:DNA-binding NarL/FixJ family response regulator